MSEQQIFSINEFAKFARTTHATLLHYDKIGLLVPARRGEHNYRYYTGPQLGSANLIRMCQDMGMKLSEILVYRNNRSLEGCDELVDRHLAKIDEEIERLQGSKKLLMTLNKVLNSVRDIDENNIAVHKMPAERIVIGEPNDYSDGRNFNDALLSFYRDSQTKYPNMNLNYPVWGLFTEERIKKRDWKWPSRYYLYNPEGRDSKPAGLYAIGYARGGYGDSNEVYGRLLSWIDEHGYEICGPAYEEYPLNEITVGDPNNYLMRVSITVRKKSEVT